MMQFAQIAAKKRVQKEGKKGSSGLKNYKLKVELNGEEDGSLAGAKGAESVARRGKRGKDSCGVIGTKILREEEKNGPEKGEDRRALEAKGRNLNYYYS